jgi:hypothetical protein
MLDTEKVMIQLQKMPITNNKKKLDKRYNDLLLSNILPQREQIEALKDWLKDC